MIAASKYHGYGNDFIVVPAAQCKASKYRDTAVAICDRHFGVGADGCIFLDKPKKGRFPIRIFNQDGSEAEMSGNGTRCVAAYLHHKGRASSDEIVFVTPSGEKTYRLIDFEFPVWSYSARMGNPGFSSDEVPFLTSRYLESIRNVELTVGERLVRVSALWVGNPQCVVFVEEVVSGDLFDELGRGLSRHPSFPQGTNVSFVRRTGVDSLEIKIWERGVGPTESSGTGSCGAAVAAIVEGKVRSPVTVGTASGSQVVEWEPGQEIQLSGDACFVADVEFYRPTV